MSRCYPYPPPGYQKKAQLPDVNMPPKVFPKEKKKNKDKEKEKKVKDFEKEKNLKELTHMKENSGEKAKEKHKDKRDKNKKEKRKKGSETNGIGHDKDSLSNKLQRTSGVSQVLHSNEENGRCCQTAISDAVACQCPLERHGRNAAKPCNSVLGPVCQPHPMYIKNEQQPNGRVDPTLPSVVLSKSLAGRPPDGEATASTRPNRYGHSISSSQRPNFSSQRPQKLLDFSICDNLPPLAAWSTVDDEDWLLPKSEPLHSKPKVRVEQDTSQEVWAEAIYLPSVDMYALPYVVPY